MARSSLDNIEDRSWNSATARHLLNRAGFGVPRSRVEALAAMTPQDAVESLMRPDTIPQAAAPTFIQSAPTYAERNRQARKLPEEERRKRNQENNRQERRYVRDLQVWWIDRMRTTPYPLEEKMALFWHGHFATSAQKVRSVHQNYALNALFRRHATGNFKRLTTQVGQSPAMLIYLDNRQNRKGKPNENWARELMELFTLGQGNYSEDDIKESARAFTGWNFDRNGFVTRENTHDKGIKNFLGQRGNFDGSDIIDVIFQERAAADFIARKLWTFFAYEEPDDKIVAELAQTLRENNYEIKPMLEQMFLSQAFYSDKAMGTQIKSPAQFLVQLTDDLMLETPPLTAMAQVGAQLGQNLFYPPNVKGWDGNRAWINANTLLIRYGVPRRLLLASANEEIAGPNMMQGSMAGDKESNQKDRFNTYMETLPSQRQSAIRKSLAKADNPRQRRSRIQNMLQEDALKRVWDPARLFPAQSYPNGDTCIDSLAKQMLVADLDTSQRSVLKNTLGVTNAPVERLSIPRTSMEAALHLLMSTAEYQLC